MKPKLTCHSLFCPFTSESEAELEKHEQQQTHANKENDPELTAQTTINAIEKCSDRNGQPYFKIGVQ
jgi:hypothetical protein